MRLLLAYLLFTVLASVALASAGKLADIESQIRNVHHDLIQMNAGGLYAHSDHVLSEKRRTTLQLKLQRLQTMRQALEHSHSSSQLLHSAVAHGHRSGHRGFGPQLKTRNWIKQPLDHFSERTKATFNQSYYYSTAFYKSTEERQRDGDKDDHVPVFFYDPGESGVYPQESSTYDDTIMYHLAREFGGIFLIVEHRYFGHSVPNRSDLGPGRDWGADQMQFLTVKQALEDSAEVIRKVRFNGTSPNDKYRWIYYGGSYAGARSVFMRKTYPDLVFGAISSSGVVSAVNDFYEYFFPVARGADVACVQALQSSVHAMDKILAPDPKKGSQQSPLSHEHFAQLRGLFNLTHVNTTGEFGSMLTSYLGEWQTNTWRTQKTSIFNSFCKAMTDYNNGTALKERESKRFPLLRDMPWTVYSYAYAMSHPVYSTGTTAEQDVESGAKRYQNQEILSSSRAWSWMTCNEFGFWQVAPPVQDVDAHPPRYSGPKIVSSAVDVHYMTEVCRKGYAKGRHYNLPSTPHTDWINHYGNVNIDMDRLAIINAQWDPWRPATQHSEEFAYGGVRTSTYERPFHLIPDCWHTCEIYSYQDLSKEPERIRTIHENELKWVRYWLTGEALP